MLKYRLLTPIVLAVVILAACQAAPTTTVAPAIATGTPQPTATHTAAPTETLTPSPTPEPVEFVLQIIGDPNPLSSPSGLALDAQGNLYVADTLNHRVQKFDSNGQFLTSWGSKGSGDGQFNFIWGDPDHNLPLGSLAIDGEGNIYVADGGNARIQKFDSYGNFLTKWGSEGTGDGQFARPEDLAVDPQSNIIVIDDRSSPRGRIQKFDSNGNFLARFGEGLFIDPGLIAVDGQGNIYVPDVVFGTILKLDSNGNLLGTWAGDGQFSMPIGIEVDSEGNIYVVDSGNGRIQKLDKNGELLFRWGIKGNGDGQFSEPFAVTVDGEGNIYISDYLNNRIQKFRQR